jgi:hypothetical protein
VFVINDDRALVGSILNGETWVLEEPMEDPRHEAIIRAVAACHAPPSVEAVAQQLQKDGLLEQVGGVAYLTELAGIAEANRKEAYDRGYAEGRGAQAGRMVRIYPPEGTPYDDEDVAVDIELAYWDGWTRGTYEVVAAQLAGQERELSTAILMQFAHNERPEAQTLEDIDALTREGIYGANEQMQL